jgi:hypothetical protein
MLPAKYRPATRAGDTETPRERSSNAPIALQMKSERDAALQRLRDSQLEVAALKAELDRERGAQAQLVEQRLRERERDVRMELNSEWSKNEAAWKERIRNERLLRLSYERVLVNLGFAPSRIASDIVRVSRPQPLHEDPQDYNTMNLLDMEAGTVSQPSTRRKGLFAYSMEDIKASMALPETKTWTASEVSGDATPVTHSPPSNDFFSLGGGSVGKRELLRSLADPS